MLEKSKWHPYTDSWQLIATPSSRLRSLKEIVMRCPQTYFSALERREIQKGLWPAWKVAKRANISMIRDDNEFMAARQSPQNGTKDQTMDPKLNKAELEIFAGWNQKKASFSSIDRDAMLKLVNDTLHALVRVKSWFSTRQNEEDLEKMQHNLHYVLFMLQEHEMEENGEDSKDILCEINPNFGLVDEFRFRT